MLLAYVEQCVVPTLRRGDIVVMDKLPTHKVAGHRGWQSKVPGQRFGICRSILLTSTLSSLRQALLRKVAERTVRVSSGPFVLSLGCSVPRNVPITSDMLAMLPYDRNPL
jgi:hypothetical protein